MCAKPKAKPFAHSLRGIKIKEKATKTNQRLNPTMIIYGIHASFPRMRAELKAMLEKGELIDIHRD